MFEKTLLIEIPRVYAFFFLLYYKFWTCKIFNSKLAMSSEEDYDLICAISKHIKYK